MQTGNKMNYQQAIDINAQNFQKFIERVNSERQKLGLEPITPQFNFATISKAKKYKETKTQ